MGGGYLRRSDSVHTLHDSCILYYLPKKLLLPAHMALSELESSGNHGRTGSGPSSCMVGAREVADSCDSLVRRWSMLATDWRGHGVLLGQAAAGAHGHQEAILSCSFNLFEICVFVFTKNRGSIAAGCRSSFVSEACLFVPAVNLVFSCLLNRVAKSEQRAIYADGAWSWNRMA